MLLERVVRERGGAEAQCPSKALLTHLVFQKNPNMYFPAAIPNHYPVSLTGISFFLRSSVPMSSIECCYGKLPGPPVTPLSALEIPRDLKLLRTLYHRPTPTPRSLPLAKSKTILFYLFVFWAPRRNFPQSMRSNSQRLPTPHPPDFLCSFLAVSLLRFILKSFRNLRVSLMVHLERFTHGPPKAYL